MAAVLLSACQGQPWIGLRGKEGLHGAAAAGKTLAALDELHVKPSSYNWTFRGKVEGRAGPHVGYGEFLSLSDDGRTMATGAGYPAVSGYIQVFRWQDASVNASWHRPPSWVQLGNDINGTHVHLSKNGLVIAIGRRGSDNRGRMTMYQWNQAQFEWEQMGNHIEGLDMLAESGRRSGEVAISSRGHVVAIGEKQLISNTGAVRRGPCPKCRHAGAVRVFRWSAASGDWVQYGATIRGDDGVEYFGRSLSLNGEGNVLALAQGGQADAPAGLVRVYKWEAPAEGNASVYSWIQMGDAIAGEAGEDRAGSSLILSESGATVAVAHNVLTPTHDQKAALRPGEEPTSRGHVRVFQWSNTAQVRVRVRVRVRVS